MTIHDGDKTGNSWVLPIGTICAPLVGLIVPLVFHFPSISEQPR